MFRSIVIYPRHLCNDYMYSRIPLHCLFVLQAIACSCWFSFFSYPSLVAGRLPPLFRSPSLVRDTSYEQHSVSRPKAAYVNKALKLGSAFFSMLCWLQRLTLSTRSPEAVTMAIAAMSRVAPTAMTLATALRKQCHPWKQRYEQQERHKQ